MSAVAAGKFYPRQLFDAVTGERLTRARTPNAGSFFKIPLDGGLPSPLTNRGFQYTDGDLNGHEWSEMEDMEIVVYASWTTGRHYIEQLNTSVAEGLSVVFTSPCGFSPAGMYPNSGNRYYAENTVEMVDTEGEWHVSRRTGTLTLYSSSDPSGRQLVLGRGDTLREGVLVKSTVSRRTVLLANQTRGPVSLPANTVAWGASSFTLAATIVTNSSASDQMIFYKGPRSHQVVC